MPDTNITKSALASSMKRLMREKPFAKISIIDICDGCGMNRKSFYYHFKDKYDLVYWIFYSDFISLVSNTSHEDGWDLLISVGKLFYEDQEFYRAALKVEGQNSFREYFVESMTPLVTYFLQDICDVEEDGEDSVGLLISILCDAYLNAILRWLENGCSITPEEQVTSIKKIIMKMARRLNELEEK